MPIFQNPEMFSLLVDLIAEHIKSLPNKITKIAGLDARGFLIAPPVALKLSIPFIPIRKAGKLPGECLSATYQKEYGEDVFQIQADAIGSDDRVVVIDDIIATGMLNTTPSFSYYSFCINIFFIFRWKCKSSWRAGQESRWKSRRVYIFT